MKVLVLSNTSKGIYMHSERFLINLSRYGEDASVFTENAAFAVGNVALTAYNIGGLGPKAVCV